jgi:hypothetical protein
MSAEFYLRVGPGGAFLDSSRYGRGDDVHRYLTIDLNGRRAIVDATFPGPPWDGRSDLPLACGPGVDHPSEGDPDREKRTLEESYCDPVLRDRFIEALS